MVPATVDRQSACLLRRYTVKSPGGVTLGTHVMCPLLLVAYLTHNSKLKYKTRTALATRCMRSSKQKMRRKYIEIEQWVACMRCAGLNITGFTQVKAES